MTSSYDSINTELQAMYRSNRPKSYGHGGHGTTAHHGVQAAHSAHAGAYEDFGVITRREQEIAYAKELDAKADRARRHQGMIAAPSTQPEKKKGFWGALWGCAKNFVKGGTVGFVKSLWDGATKGKDGKFSLWKTLGSVALAVGVGAAIVATGGVGLAVAGAAGLAMSAPGLIKHGGNTIQNLASGNYDKAIESSYHAGEAATGVALSATSLASGLKAIQATKMAAATNSARQAVQGVRAAYGPQYAQAQSALRAARASGDANAIKAAADAVKAAKAAADPATVSAAQQAFKSAWDARRALQARQAAIQALSWAKPVESAKTMAREGSKELFNVDNMKTAGGQLRDTVRTSFNAGKSTVPAPATTTAVPAQAQATATSAAGSTGRVQAAANATKKLAGSAMTKAGELANPGNRAGAIQVGKDVARTGGRFLYDPAAPKFTAGAVTSKIPVVRGAINTAGKVQWQNMPAMSPVILGVKDDSEHTADPSAPKNLDQYYGEPTLLDGGHGYPEHGYGGGHGAEETPQFDPNAFNQQNTVF